MKTEFSKKLLRVSYFISISLTLFFCVCTILQIDTTNLKDVVIVSWAEVASANGFYYWKAKLENKIKLEHEYGIKTVDQNDENIIDNENMEG